MAQIAGTFGKAILWILCPVALMWGGWLAIGQTRSRVLDVCIVSDLEYRIVKPGWEAQWPPLFREVNQMFSGTGVSFRARYGGDAYAESAGGDMAERWQLVNAGSCQADIVVGLTGRSDSNNSTVAPPFSHAALIKDTGTNSDAKTAAMVARSLASLFGAPVSAMAVVNTESAQDSFFGAPSMEIIRRMRGYDFASGAAALTGSTEKKAIAALTGALTGVKPHAEAEAHKTVARAFATSRRFDDAARQLRAAVASDGNNGELRFELAMALKSAARPDEAIEELKKAVRLEPENAVAYAAMGTILLNSSRLDEAIDAWQTAARIEPRNATYHTALAQALSFRPGRLKEAAAEFETAVRLQPLEESASVGLAGQAVAGEKLQEVVRAVEADVQRQAESVDGHLRLGMAHGYAGNLDVAVREVRRALEIDPQNGRAHLTMAELRYLSGEYAEANAEIAAARAAGAEPKPSLVDGIRRKISRQDTR